MLTMDNVVISRINRLRNRPKVQRRVIAHGRRRWQIVRISEAEQTADTPECLFEPTNLIWVVSRPKSVVPVLRILHYQQALALKHPSQGCRSDAIACTSGTVRNGRPQIAGSDSEALRLGLDKLHTKKPAVNVEDLARPVSLLFFLQDTIGPGIAILIDDVRPKVVKERGKPVD